jgi:hypothetical protein
MLRKLILTKLFLTSSITLTSCFSIAAPPSQPQYQPQSQSVHSNWIQKLTDLKDSTFTYWQPYIKTTDTYLTNKFNNEYHPFIIHAYQAYYKNYGPQVSESVFALNDFLSPILNNTYKTTSTFVYSQSPELFDDIENVPTPIKIGYEKLIFSAWNLLNQNSERLENLSENVKSAVSFTQILLDARKEPTDLKLKSQLLRLRKLVNEIRVYNDDLEMRSCFEVHVVDIPLVNSFNTGCNIFVTAPVTVLLTDEELRATLAHEMSHGDQGHTVKNLIELSKQTGIHLSFLMMDELDWLVTGKYSPRLSQVIKEGNAPIIFDAFGKQAPEVEINADIGATVILEKSGHSANDLINALIKLTDASILEKQISNQQRIESIRKYPELQKRIEKIRAGFSQ